MSVTAETRLTLTVTETSELGLDDITSPATLRSEIPAGLENHTGTTTPAVSKQFGGDVQLSGGSAAFDFTAVDKGDLPTEDWTGLRVELAKFKAAGDNTAFVTVETLSPNDYDLFGANTRSINLQPGQEMLFRLNGQGAVIGAADKDIEFNSVDDDAIVSVQFVAG